MTNSIWLKRRWHFNLTASEWQAIKHLNSKPGKLKAAYCNIFAEMLRMIRGYCPIALQYHHLKKKDGRKKSLSYARPVAKCKFTGCCQYVLHIEEPRRQWTVTVTIVRQGNFKHSSSEINNCSQRVTKRQAYFDSPIHQPHIWFWKYAKMESDEALGDEEEPECSQEVKIRTNQWYKHTHQCLSCN